MRKYKSLPIELNKKGTALSRALEPLAQAKDLREWAEDGRKFLTSREKVFRRYLQEGLSEARASHFGLCFKGREGNFLLHLREIKRIS